MTHDWMKARDVAKAYVYAKAYGAGEQSVSRILRDKPCPKLYHYDYAALEARILGPMMDGLQEYVTMIGQDQEEQRMRSFLERYCVERARECIRQGSEQADTWRVMLDGKLAYKMAEQIAHGERADRERNIRQQQEKEGPWQAGTARAPGGHTGITGPVGAVGAAGPYPYVKPNGVP